VGVRCGTRHRGRAEVRRGSAYLANVTHWFAYPNIDPIAFRLGPIAVHWYGLSYLFGFICVFLWMNRPAGRRRLGLTTDEIQDFLVYALVGVLVGGRAGFVIADIITQHNKSDYLAHPLNFIAVWQGGMAFHGALIGVMLASVLYLRKHPRLSFNVLFDEVVMLLPIGIALTRVVNFINDELVGKVCDPDQPFCVAFPNYTGYRYPSQIFEGILDILVLPILLLVYRRRPADGVVAWTWFTLYGITRSIAEIWREPGFTVLGLSGGQLAAIPQIFIGLGMLIWSIRRGKHARAR
jgi:phosphatidylglycerol:prolipoprotein diacylglycerol transferase